MPQIKEYTNAIEGLRPTEAGVDARLQNARRSGAFFNQVADSTASTLEQAGRGFNSAIRYAGEQAVAYAEHREISQGAAAYAGLNDRLTAQWNDATKDVDPNDPTVAQKFREGVLEPELEKYGQSFLTEGGQKYAEARVASLRNHFFEKTSADMSSLAADAVVVNVRQTTNGFSNTAMRDPSSVPHLLDGIDATIDGLISSSPNLKGAAASKARITLAEKMREDIVSAGAIGAIQSSSNPEATAKAWGEKYPQYINGATLKQLEGNARQQIRADRIDATYQEHQAEKQAQKASDARETQILQKLYSDSPEDVGSVSTKAIVNDPTLNRVAKERMISVVNRELRPETAAQESNRNYLSVLQKIRSGEISDVGAIYDARINGKLNRGDFNQALKDFTEYKSPGGESLSRDRADFFKRYAPTIDPSIGDINSMQFGHHSALGLQKMYEAERAARRAEEDARKRNQDPHTVYDPSSPDFFGKPQNLMKYRASMQESAAFQAEISKGKVSANPSGQGETVVGVDVKDAPAFKPPAGWQFSASRQQYRDPDGKLYDMSGKPVK